MTALKRISLKIRKRLPPRLRNVLRFGKILANRGQSSACIPPELLDEARICSSRNELIKLLPWRSTVAEVGTYRGQFARLILDTCDPVKLYLVDLDFSLLDPSVAKDERVEKRLGVSHEVLGGFPNEYFDWIYIDADHSYEGVSRDASAAASKVKPRGHIIFNDFAHADPFLGAYGVHRAVVDFIVNRRWPLTWLAYEPSGLYDVAVRRPQS